MSTRNEHVCSLCVLGGVALLFALAVWWPLQAGASSRREQVATAHAALDNAHHAVAETASLTTKLRQINEWRHTLAAGVPAVPQLADCLAQLGADLTQVKAVNPQIKTQPVTDAGAAQVIPFSVEFQSSSESAFDFLRRVESSGRIMHVNRLHIKRSIDESRGPVKVSIDVSTFCRPLPGGSS